MGKINLLSSKVYNRIAAGEVVERPSSVVKELVENSLDAKATNITIEIEKGGITSIKVTDNGFGIEKSELKKALLPHATSKIATVSDLDNISSFGFRGEALASIASVSKIILISKPEEQEMGAKITAIGGEISDITYAPLVTGTSITVNNLFFNTPVREKFLRSEKSEENEVTSTVARFILGNPSVSFLFVCDGKTIYQSYGDGFESAMACVYGVSILNDCFYIDTEKHGIKLNGYISKHYFTKSNRSYQTAFINNRYVVNQTVSSAISNAYSSYLMKRQYPFYVINISLPSEIVDVNVHPNKLDVRFSNNQIIYGSIYSAISKVLDGSSEALNIVNETKAEVQPIKPKFTSDEQVDYRVNKPVKPALDVLTFNDSGAKSISINDDLLTGKKESNCVDIFAENKAYIESLVAKKSQQSLEDVIKIDSEIKIIGQVLNTYIIFESGDEIYFIDQHAAHERILFDKICASVSKDTKDLQPLLIPYLLNVNSQESDFINSKLSVFNSLGIEIEEFGLNSYKISAIPTYLTQMNLGKFFSEILADLNSLRTINTTDILFEKIAQKACKSAIKSGHKLSELEINEILDKIKGDLGLKCPHGRPVVVKITRTEIDKWFKRII